MNEANKLDSGTFIGGAFPVIEEELLGAIGGATMSLPRQLSIEWAADYGIDRRCGWSITVDGHVVVELQPTLFEALAKLQETLTLKLVVLPKATEGT